MRFQIFLCLTVLIVISGCGGAKKGPVLVSAIGTVTFKGQPVAGATVSMLAEKGEISNGFTGADGKFKMTTGGRPGVPVGKLKVGITKRAAAEAAPPPKARTPEDMKNMQKAGHGVAKDLAPKNELPEKYANPSSSQLEANVDANGSKNVFEFSLVE